MAAKTMRKQLISLIRAHGCFTYREGLPKKMRTPAEPNRTTFLARERILLLEYRGRRIGKGWRLARKQPHRNFLIRA